MEKREFLKFLIQLGLIVVFWVGVAILLGHINYLCGGCMP